MGAGGIAFVRRDHSDARASAKPAGRGGKAPPSTRVDVARVRALQLTSRMRRLTHRTLGRRLAVAVLAAAWGMAPGFPAIACTLATVDEPVIEAAMPNCHHAEAGESATSSRRETGHPCCRDAETSCCLRSLDIDGAISALFSLEIPAIALPTPSPLLADVRMTAAVFPPAPVPDASPPGSRFRVLRL